MSGSQKIGNWQGVRNNLEKIKDIDLEQALDQVNEEYLLFLKEAITGNRIEAAKLDEAYERRKIKKYGEKPPLVGSGKYVNGLRVGKKRLDSTTIAFGVGGFEEDEYKPNVNMAMIANWLENGTAKMSPKPHFRPTWNEFKPRYLPLIQRGVNVQLNSKLGG